MRIVTDTNVFVAAVSNPDGASREELRRCLRGRYVPLMGQALLAEYESVLGRAEGLRVLDRLDAALGQVARG